MKKALALSLTVALIAVSAMFLQPGSFAHAAGVGPSLTALIYNSGDPCLNPNVAKSFAAVNISGAAATNELVAAVAGKTVYMCSLQASVVGTSPTIQFETGTKVSTACDTGAVVKSGTFAIVTTSLAKFSGDGGTTNLTGASGGELCLVAGGTTPSIQGTLVFVQQ